MTTKQQLHAAIDRAGDENLDELLRLVTGFIAAKQPERSPGLLAKLKQIRIDAPADFSANLDQYVSGEKSIDDGVR